MAHDCDRPVISVSCFASVPRLPFLYLILYAHAQDGREDAVPCLCLHIFLSAMSTTTTERMDSSTQRTGSNKLNLHTHTNRAYGSIQNIFVHYILVCLIVCLVIFICNLVVSLECVPSRCVCPIKDNNNTRVMNWKGSQHTLLDHLSFA